MEIVPLTLNTYTEFIHSSPVVVLHFRADWNQYDQVMTRRLSRLAPSFASEVRIGTIDVDQEEFSELLATLKVENLPTLAWFKDGRHVDTSIGLSIREHIEGKLRRLLRN